MLVDQNQPYEDGCKLNDLQVMVNRVQGLVAVATSNYQGVPITVMGHSMGCGIIARMNLADVMQVIFIAPDAGDQTVKMLQRHGSDILTGQVIKTSDGLTKFISKEFVTSVHGVVWENEYAKLLERYQPVYVFASGDEEIVGDARLAHEHIPFAGYKVIPCAKHNFAGEPLKELFAEQALLLPN